VVTNFRFGFGKIFLGMENGEPLFGSVEKLCITGKSVASLQGKKSLPHPTPSLEFTE
jgi:hypothetical protein